MLSGRTVVGRTVIKIETLPSTIAVYRFLYNMSKKAAAKAAVEIDDSEDIMDVPSTPTMKKGKAAAALLVATPVPTPKTKAAGAPATDPAPPKAKRAAKPAAPATVDAVLTTPTAKPRAKKAVAPATAVEGTTVPVVERPAENYSLKIATLEKMATVMGCTNSHRVFINVPPNLVDDKAMATLIRDWGITTLKYNAKKGLETIQVQLDNRKDSNVCVYGWVTEADGIDLIFNKFPGYSYYFLYPAVPVEYAKLMIADGATKEDASKGISIVESVYYTHLKYQHDKIVTVLV
jgi:hypothetical protein